MSGVRISALPPVTNSNLTDVIPSVQGGVTNKETLQQIFNLFLANTILNFAGDPNGNLAGVRYQLCWDLTNNELWVCTTTGSSSTAVWQLSAGSGGVTPLEVQQSAFNVGTDTGTDGLDYIVDLSPPVTSLTDGLLVTIIPQVDNIGQSANLSVNGLSAAVNNPLFPHDIIAGLEAIFVYNSSNGGGWTLLNPFSLILAPSNLVAGGFNYFFDNGTGGANTYVVPNNAAGVSNPGNGPGEGLLIALLPNSTNTGASTLNLFGSGAAPIVTTNGADLMPGMLQYQVFSFLIYSSFGGSHFYLINPYYPPVQSYDLHVPTTGFTYTIPIGVNAEIFNPSGTLASGTAQMPSIAIDGQEIEISSTKTITSFTVTPNSGQTLLNSPTTLPLGSSVKWKYVDSISTWVPLETTSGNSLPTLTFAGNPNSHLAGTTYQLCWDSSNNVIWVCTTSGNSSTTVWTLPTSTSTGPIFSGTGAHSAQGGTSAVAAGAYDFTFGQSCNSDSSTSNCWNFGTSCTALNSAIYSLVFGNTCEVNSSYAFSFGNGCNVNTGSDYAWAVGQNALAQGIYGVAWGNNPTTNSSGSWVIGDSITSPAQDTASDQYNATFGNGFNFYYRVSGTPTIAASIDPQGNLINNRGTANKAYQYVTPSDGGTVNINAATELLTMVLSSSYASLTVNLFGSPVDGQRIRIATSQAVALFNLGGSGIAISNPPTSLVARQVVMYTYIQSQNLWCFG